MSRGAVHELFAERSCSQEVSRCQEDQLDQGLGGWPPLSLELARDVDDRVVDIFRTLYSSVGEILSHLRAATQSARKSLVCVVVEAKLDSQQVCCLDTGCGLAGG